MLTKKLYEKPKAKNLKIQLIIGTILCFTVIPIMQYFTELSGFPAQIFSSQLSFNGDIMKSFYAVTNIELYRVAPLLDYIFMVGYGLILFSLSVLIARKYGLPSKLGQICLITAVSGVIAASCDGVENIFILAMLTDPVGFPNYWAVSHSIFALIKWILLFITITLVIIFGILSLVRSKKKQNKSTKNLKPL
ncbi:MAG: hypothetical protein ACFFCY_13690 [Promethearchaeota archaeon]